MYLSCLVFGKGIALPEQQIATCYQRQHCHCCIKHNIERILLDIVIHLCKRLRAKVQQFWELVAFSPYLFYIFWLIVIAEFLFHHLEFTRYLCCRRMSADEAPTLKM